ncbi:transglycosylase domain-containing protein [Novosphingobium sp.]|uniref:transglycosylase domain-containing protein n=1 Tax=Novosphingobium sp. TaxID=1874826 RepID=UPI00286DC157|nr:transglycosylase domain-containing protein [Novosphingobium sp.]
MTLDPNWHDERQQQIADFYTALRIHSERTGPFTFGWFVARLRALLKAGAAQPPHYAAGWGAPDAVPQPATQEQQAATTTQTQCAAVLVPALIAAVNDEDQDASTAGQGPEEPIMAEPLAAAQLVLDTPAPEGLQIATAPGDEGGTLQIDAAERAPPQPPGPGWWARQKAAAAQRRERARQRPRRSRMHRVARFSSKSLGYGCLLVYGIGNLTEPLAAAAYGEGTSVSDALANKAGIMIIGSGTRPVFARPPEARPDDPSRAHLPEAARKSANFEKATFMATALEDKRAFAPALSLEGIMRVHGTDTLALMRAGWSQFAVLVWRKTKRRGGSTVPVTTCSISLNSMAMPSGLIAKIKAKFNEHVCAARLEAETRGDTQAQAGMMLDNAALIIGGGADTQGVTLASWRLFSKDFSKIDRDCHLSVLAAAVNQPFYAPGESPSSQRIAADRLVNLADRAKRGLTALRKREGQGLNASDEACFATLPALLNRRFRNPAGDMTRAFGSAAPQIIAEAFAYRARNPGTVQLTAQFDAMANEAAIQRVGNTACAIADRKAIRLNICPEKGPVDRAQVRVIAINPNGSVHRMIAIGAGAASALAESQTGDLPGRGSVGKGILLPILADNLFCRFDFPDLKDADGVAGVDHDCRADELTPPAYAVKTSLNQPFVYALAHTDQGRLALYRDALGLRQQNLRDLVLGNRPAATQVLMRDYVAVTSPARVGPTPHFIVEAGSAQVDLSSLISAADSARTRQLLSEPTKPGGTVHAAAGRLKAAGYTVVWAKSGTSEAGFDSDERGKHIIMELIDPEGQTRIVFAEISSSDSAALAGSGVMSSADIAEIIIATLQPES